MHHVPPASLSLNLPLIFFLLMVPISGFIAWAGDRIGHKVGKKRHTLFGLRPRHTAILFTVGAGMCVALASFGLMWLASESFRVVLREGTALVHNNESLRGDNTRLTLLNQREESRVRVLMQQAESAKSNAATLQARRQQAEQQYQTARRNLEGAVRDLRLSRTALNQSQSHLSTANHLLTEKTARVRVAQAELHVAERKRSEAAQNARYAEQLAREAAKEAFAAREKVTNLRRSATAVVDYQSKRMAAQSTEIAARDAHIAEQDKRIGAQAAEFERRRLELSRLVLSVEEQRRKSDGLLGMSLSSTSALRQGQITYQVGEEVDRLALQPGGNVWQVRYALDSLLASAAKRAEAKGATGGEGSKRAVLLLPRPVASGDGDKGSLVNSANAAPVAGGATNANIRNDEGNDASKVRLVNEDEQLRGVASAIRLANEPIVVVASAAANAVAGEPVPVDLKIYRNPVVLSEGSVVGETVLDTAATNPDTDATDRLYAFLHNDVRHQLLKAGVIPTLATGREGSIVTLSGREWLTLVERVRRAGEAGSVRIIVRAARNLRAADPVALRFEVTGEPVTARVSP